MFRPFLIWSSSGWIQLSEKLHNIIQYDTIISVSISTGRRDLVYKKSGGHVWGS